MVNPLSDIRAAFATGQVDELVERTVSADAPSPPRGNVVGLLGRMGRKRRTGCNVLHVDFRRPLIDERRG